MSKFDAIELSCLDHLLIENQQMVHQHSVYSTWHILQLGAM